MRTEYLLLAQYDGRATLPIETVSRDFFDLTVDKFMRKVMSGQIPLPIIRMEASLKAARFVHVSDLAAYLDKQREAATREAKQLARAS